ncbi:hypothetical protein LY76DRAFT_419175 [Colletotrichum caudatum]|nr:hypothetical protein LY76DRAFT_419175 [Colletotrichum caudatum]
MDEVSPSVSPDQSLYEDTAATPSSDYSVDAGENGSVVSVESGYILYHNVHGRGYVVHNRKTYWRPCSTEFDELMHYVFDGLVTAKCYKEPFLVNPQKVLDVGTGLATLPTSTQVHPSLAPILHKR